MKFSRITNAGIVYRNINDVDDFKDIKSEDEDNIYIKAIPVRNVSINGSVLFPGTYPMKEGDGILELINLAGGYSDNAYPFGGVLINKSTQEISEAAKIKLNESFLNNVLSLVSNNPENSSDIQAFVSLMEELKSSPVSGRVSAEFDIEILKRNSETDILLQEGDKITIPEFLNQVYVFGEVLSAGTVPYVDGKDYMHFIDSKGGYNSYSDKENIFVLQPNGETIKIENVKNVFMSKKNNKSISIYPGSVIFVPRKLDDEIIRRQSLQAYTSILSSLGVSLASLSILKE
jgi:protein involved in polysaccharide export with SLBB domain